MTAGEREAFGNYAQLQAILCISSDASIATVVTICDSSLIWMGANVNMTVRQLVLWQKISR